MRAVMTAAVLVFAVAVASCKKVGSTSAAVEPADTTAYTIKLPDRKAAGAKWTVTKRSVTTATVHVNSGQQVDEKTSEERYVQTVITPDEKILRTYQYARDTDKAHGEVSRSYSGKAVTITKKNDLYTFTVDGKPLTNAGELAKEFESGKSFQAEDLLPTSAVRVNEQWLVSKDVMRKIARRSTGSMDPEKSSFSGKLIRAYQSEGKLWGAIEWHVQVDTSNGEARGPKSASGTIALEGPIDGSVGEEKRSRRITGSWIEDGKKGEKVKFDFEQVDTTTYIPN